MSFDLAGSACGRPITILRNRTLSLRARLPRALDRIAMEQRVRLNLLSTAIVLALGIAASAITSTIVAARAFERRGEQVSRAERDITIKGSARRRVKADQGVWRVEIQGEGADIPAAYESLERAAGSALEFLSARGFAEGEIQLSAIDTEMHFARNEHGQLTRAVESYTLERTIVLSSADVDRIAAAAGEVTRLLRENLHVRSHAPQYTLSDVGALKIDLLGEASADARQRAHKIAAETGCRISEVRSAQQGVIQITEPHSTEVSASGIYDTATIDKDISVVVTVTFGIEPE
jgi:hypothetical protein